MIMNERTFVLKGTICYSNSLTELSITENGYLVCEDGRCAGVFDELPEKFAGISCTDFGDELIIPGLTDLHLHAPQYTFRASGMDLELLDWLNTYTFPQEARYEDTEFAKEAYSIFAEDMKKSPNTRACIFGTLHVPATEILMEQLDKTGIKAMVGKVNMDRNGSPQLQEESAQASADATVQWIKDTLDKFENVKPILTPRFTPSCSHSLQNITILLICVFLCRQSNCSILCNSQLYENLKTTSLSQFTLHINGTSHCFNQISGNSHSKTGSLDLIRHRIFGTGKSIKDFIFEIC